MDVMEAMNTCTAMRYFQQKAVPEDIIRQLIFAATRASNPGNSQAWQFLVIDDPAIKTALGEKILAGMATFFDNRPPGRDGVEERMFLGAEHLAQTYAQVPAWIVCLAHNAYPPHAPEEHFMHSAIYPAAQNLIVAARSLGLGACFTTFPGLAEPEIRRLCQVPDELHMFVHVAVGYPDRAFRPVQRRPIDEVLAWNRFSA